MARYGGAGLAVEGSRRRIFSLLALDSPAVTVSSPLLARLSLARPLACRAPLSLLLARRSCYSPPVLHTMASLVVSPADKILQLIVSSFPDLSIAHTTAPADAPKSILTFESKTTVSGTNTIATYLSKHIPRFTASEPYSAIETAEIQQWLTLTAAEPIPRQTLVDLNDNLKFRSTLLGERFSIADVVAYVRLKDVVAGWSDEQRTGEKEGLPHIVRWLDFVQNSEELGLTVPEAEKVQIDADKVLFHPKPEEPVRQKKEKKEGEDQQQPKKLKGRAGAAEKARLAAEAAAGKVAETAQVVTEAAKDTAEKAKEVVVGAPKPQRTEKKQKPKKEPPPPKEGPSSHLPPPLTFCSQLIHPPSPRHYAGAARPPRRPHPVLPTTPQRGLPLRIDNRHGRRRRLPRCNPRLGNHRPTRLRDGTLLTAATRAHRLLRPQRARPTRRHARPQSHLRRQSQARHHARHQVRRHGPCRLPSPTPWNRRCA